MAELKAKAGGGGFMEAGTWTPEQVPTAADKCVLTATSGSVTCAVDAVCRSLIEETGYAGTLTINTGKFLRIGDATAAEENIALKLVSTSTLTQTGTGTLSFISTSATTQTLDFGGKTTGTVVMNGAGSSYKLESNWTASAEFSFRSGTLNINGKTCSWPNIASTENLNRTIKGSGTISLTATTGEVWKITNTAKFTTEEVTGLTIKVTSLTNNPRSFVGGGKTYGTLVNEGTSGSLTISGANTFKAIEPVKKSVTKLTKGETQTLTEVPAWKGAAGELITVESTEAGAAATLSAASGTAKCDYLKLKDSKATGGATFYAGSHSESVSGNEGWKFEDEPAEVPGSLRTLLGVGS